MGHERLNHGASPKNKKGRPFPERPLRWTDLVRRPRKGKTNAAVPPHSHHHSAPKRAELHPPNRRGIFMKLVTLAALVAAQIVTAAPAAAAELVGDGSNSARQQGNFAGARLRVPLGGTERGKARAGLTLTTVQRTDLSDGRGRTAFGEGIELSLAAGKPLALRTGGVPLAQRLGAAEDQAAGKRKSSTGKKILKAAAVVAIIGAAVVGGLLLAFVVACDENRCSE
jgi:hypothetical protein